MFTDGGFDTPGWIALTGWSHAARRFLGCIVRCYHPHWRILFGSGEIITLLWGTKMWWGPMTKDSLRLYAAMSLGACFLTAACAGVLMGEDNNSR
eukprot:SAG31_NODE_3901_length_3770_cov_4.494416_6_plen_95_part_00